MTAEGKKEGIAITEPVSLWKKPIKIKPGLFKGLFNLLLDGVKLDWVKFSTDLADTLAGLELTGEAGERGWLLVTRALSRAMLGLVEEHKRLIDVDAVVPDALDERLNRILETETYYIRFDFFDRPGELELLKAVEPVYVEFLGAIGFGAPTARNLGRRLPAYFVLAAMEEWRKAPEFFQPLEQAVKTPFDKAGKLEKGWLAYLAWVKKQVDEPVFSETFSLKQVYIPLRAYVLEGKGDDKESFEPGHALERERGDDCKQKLKRVAGDLETALTAWLDKGDKDDALRVIAGGPGFGKSTFLKIFAAGLAEKNRRLLFVPLHRFEIKDDLDEAVTKFLRYGGYLDRNPLGREPLVLIFDGLDELAMQGRALAEAAKHFIGELKRKLMNYNQTETRVQAIISGRDIIIQANETEFRKKEQLLHILPYYVEEEEREDFIDKGNILEEDQRDRWWKNYGELMGKDYPGLPRELRTDDIDKLTEQPLLNYLVALSYERGEQGTIDFSSETDLNEIYNDLLLAVHTRTYEENRVHKAVEKLEYPLFTRILEEIAVSAWHGDGRTATVAKIEGHCKSSGLGRILETFKEEAKGGMVSFMAAFYFRKAGQDTVGDDTFEFTHKSFGEYLAARRLVGKLKQIHKNRLERENNFDEGWDIRECLVEWARVFGPKVLDFDLLKFIRNEIKAGGKADKGLPAAMQETVILMMNHMLRKGMPMEALGCRTYFIENRWAVNSEKALLVMLSTLADYTGKVSKISWPEVTSFGELVSRLQGQRTGRKNFILCFLNHLELEGARLDMKDLYSANLRETKLCGAVMYSVILFNADLSGADLSRADLRGANLRGARVSKEQIETAITDEDTRLDEM